MDQINPRLQAAMNAINGEVANIGLPPVSTSFRLIGDIREALNEPVTTRHDDLPEIARAKQEALAQIYEIATDPRVRELARAGLYGRLPEVAA